jgi:hypothetical protein
VSNVMRKMPDTRPEDGVYTASGPLDGVRPGRRTVKILTVRRLDGAVSEGLRPLTAFRDLVQLEVEHVSNVDLAPLAELALDTLVLRYPDDIELEPLARLDSLKSLVITHLRDVRIPPTLRLPSSLSTLALTAEGARQTGLRFKQLIEAIDWAHLTELRTLHLHVGGNELVAPVHVDLGFLRQLERLQSIDITQGVWHSGSDRSPLEPPFEGLPKTLTNVRVDAWEPERVKRDLQQYLGEEVSVRQRYPPTPDQASWTITAPRGGVRQWTTSGSLCEAADGRDGDTEYEALAAARRRLRTADPELLERLEFDQESSATTIMGTTRGDLELVLAILDLHP